MRDSEQNGEKSRPGHTTSYTVIRTTTLGREHGFELSEKLLKRYFGAYNVVGQVGDVDHEIVPDGHYHTSRQRIYLKVVHAVRLKPYLVRESHFLFVNYFPLPPLLFDLFSIASSRCTLGGRVIMRLEFA